MPDIKSVFLDKGKRLVSGALTGFSVLSIHSFRIGTTFGFEPDKEDEVPRGTHVFTGYAGLASSKATAVDTVRHSIIVPENAGPFAMGNIVIYGSHLDGTAIPFLSVVFPFSIQKVKADSQLDTNLATPTPGSRFVINIDIKHSLDGPVATIDVISPEFASLPFYDTEGNVPSPELNPWSQFIVNYDTRTKSPAFVTKKSDGTYWAVPFTVNYRNPKFGIIDGGVQGDNFEPSPYGFISGYFYSTPDEDYSAIVGGMGYEYQWSNDDQIVGGVPYQE